MRGFRLALGTDAGTAEPRIRRKGGVACVGVVCDFPVWEKARSRITARCELNTSRVLTVFFFPYRTIHTYTRWACVSYYILIYVEGGGHRSGEGGMGQFATGTIK